MVWLGTVVRFAPRVARNPAAPPLTHPDEKEVPKPAHIMSPNGNTLLPGAMASTHRPVLAYGASPPLGSLAVTEITPGSAAGYMGVATGWLPAAATTTTP